MFDKTSRYIKNIQMKKSKAPAKTLAKMPPERAALLEQLGQIARGLGETFSPFCEVVVHDLTHPKQAIASIHNNLSGRRVGDPATELGLARIADSGYPQVLANYPNRFADGRQVKSTSVGIKDSTGTYVAALCLNVDLSMFQSMQALLGQFAAMGPSMASADNLDPANADAIRARIDRFAAALVTTPRALRTHDRRELIRQLKTAGCMEVRYATDVVAQHLGVSRATIYSHAK
jgi:predicted transcriptional regulator YheO